MRKYYHWLTTQYYEDARLAIDLASGYPDAYTSSIWATGANVSKDVDGRPIVSFSQQEQEHEFTAPVLEASALNDEFVEISETLFWELRNAATPPGDG